MLSPEQFQGLAGELVPHGEEDAGFTVKTTTGHRPSKGYAVSLAGSERRVPLEDVMDDVHGDQTVGAYAKAHSASLSQRGVYMGGWSPGRGQEGHGVAYLDNSMVHRNKRVATHEMVAQNQLSMYDLNKGATVNNVYRQKPQTFNEPAGFDRPAFERDVADLYRSKAGRRSLSAAEGERQSR